MGKLSLAPVLFVISITALTSASSRVFAESGAIGGDRFRMNWIVTRENGCVAGVTKLYGLGSI